MTFLGVELKKVPHFMKMCNIVDMKIVKKLLFSGKAWGNFEKKIQKEFSSCEVKC